MTKAKGGRFFSFFLAVALCIHSSGVCQALVDSRTQAPQPVFPSSVFAQDALTPFLGSFYFTPLYQSLPIRLTRMLAKPPAFHFYQAPTLSPEDPYARVAHQASVRTAKDIFYNRLRWKPLFQRVMEWGDEYFSRELTTWIQLYPSAAIQGKARQDQLALLRQSMGNSLKARFSTLERAPNLKRLLGWGMLVGYAAGLHWVARHFIRPGSPHNIQAIVKAVHRAEQRGSLVTLCLAGEQAHNEEEAQAAVSAIVQTLEALQTGLKKVSEDKRRHLAIKLSALVPAFNPNEEAHLTLATDRAWAILEAAQRAGIDVEIDGETFEERSAQLEIYGRLAIRARERFGSQFRIGLAVQAYWRDSHGIIGRLVEQAIEKDYPIAIRLVKGAYHEPELRKGWRSGISRVWETQEETDANYQRLTWLLMKAASETHGRVYPMIASMHPREQNFALEAAAHFQLGSTQSEVHMLDGMQPHRRRQLQREGIRLRDYLLVGDDIVNGALYFDRRRVEITGPRAISRSVYDPAVPLERLSAVHPLRAPDWEERSIAVLARRLLPERFLPFLNRPNHPTAFHREGPQIVDHLQAMWSAYHDLGRSLTLPKAIRKLLADPKEREFFLLFILLHDLGKITSQVSSLFIGDIRHDRYLAHPLESFLMTHHESDLSDWVNRTRHPHLLRETIRLHSAVLAASEKPLSAEQFRHFIEIHRVPKEQLDHWVPRMVAAALLDVQGTSRVDSWNERPFHFAAGYEAYRAEENAKKSSAIAGTATGGVLGRYFDRLYRWLQSRWKVSLENIQLYWAPFVESLFFHGIMGGISIFPMAVIMQTMSGVTFNEHFLTRLSYFLMPLLSGTVGLFLSMWLYGSEISHPLVYKGKTTTQVPADFNARMTLMGRFIREAIAFLTVGVAPLVIYRMGLGWMGQIPASDILIYSPLELLGSLFFFGVPAAAYLHHRSNKEARARGDVIGTSASPLPNPSPDPSESLYRETGVLMGEVMKTFLPKEDPFTVRAHFRDGLGPLLAKNYPQGQWIHLTDSQKVVLSRLVETYFRSEVHDLRALARQVLFRLRWFLDADTRQALDAQASELAGDEDEKIRALLYLNTGGDHGEMHWLFTRFHLRRRSVGSLPALHLGHIPQEPRATISGPVESKVGSIRFYEPLDREGYLSARGFPSTDEAYLKALYEDLVGFAVYLRDRGVHPDKGIDPTFPSSLTQQFDRMGIPQSGLMIGKVASLPPQFLEAIQSSKAQTPAEATSSGSAGLFMTWKAVRAAAALILGATLGNLLGQAKPPRLQAAPNIAREIFGEDPGPKLWLMRADETPIGSYKYWGAITKASFLAHHVTGDSLRMIDQQLSEEHDIQLARLLHDAGNLLPEWMRERMTLVTASAGNHAQGVIEGAKTYRFNNLIFLPNTVRHAAPSKFQAIIERGGNIEEIEGAVDEALKAAQKYELEHEGAVMVSPSEPRVMAGHATIGMHLLDQAHKIGFEPDLVVTTIGTGGLGTGIDIMLEAAEDLENIEVIHPSPRPDQRAVMLAAENDIADALHQSIEQGRWVELPPFSAERLTFADGKAIRRLGFLPYLRFREAYQKGRLQLGKAKEETNRRAITMAARHGLKLEGAATTGLAVLMENPDLYRAHQNIVVVLTGQNISDERLTALTNGRGVDSNATPGFYFIPAALEGFVGITPSIAHWAIVTLLAFTVAGFFWKPWEWRRGFKSFRQSPRSWLLRAA